MSSPFAGWSSGSSEALLACTTQARGSIQRKRLTTEEGGPLDRLPNHDDDSDDDDEHAEDEDDADAPDVRSAAVGGVHRVDQRREEQHRKDHAADEREQEREEHVSRRIEPLLAEVPHA